MLKKMFLSILFLFYIANAAVAEKSSAPAPDKAWFVCEKDSDCFHILYECSSGVVNKKFQKEASAYYAHDNAIKNCVSSGRPSQEKIPEYRVFCSKNECASEGTPPVKARRFSSL